MVYSMTADLMTVNKSRMLMGLSELEIEKKKKKTEPHFFFKKKIQKVKT